MNMYVSNLGESVTSEMLRNAFSSYGHVGSCRIIRDHTTGVSRGFGFVEMSDEAEGEAALIKVNGSLLDGRMVSAKRAKDRPGPKGTLIERLRGY